MNKYDELLNVYNNFSKTNYTSYEDRLYLRYEDFFKKIAIEKVIFNDPVTVILWSDKTKTVVRCGENEEYDPEKGMAMAISKKFLGNKGNYYETFKKHLPEEDIGIDESNKASDLRCTTAAFKSLKECMQKYYMSDDEKEI